MIRERREELQALPVERCCQVLAVCRSEYYESLKAKEKKPSLELDAFVAAAADERTRYGYRRISAHLRKGGHEGATDKRVRLSMKRQGLAARPKRRFTRTTLPGKAEAAPNLARETAVESPRRMLVTDLTYVALPKGFAYVSVVLDAFSRRALGWAASETMDVSLPSSALSAVFEIHALDEGWIHHSDRGSQYTSSEYRALVTSRGGLLSNSRKGNPYDNAKMESFFKTYKSEEAHLNAYESLEDLKRSLQAFLDDYNSQRLHSSLGYRSPEEFETLHAEGKQLCVR